MIDNKKALEILHGTIDGELKLNDPPKMVHRST